MTGKKRGRKPSGNQVRNAEVKFNLTPQDAEWLEEAAERLGFTTRGQMLTAIVERLVISKFAPVSWLAVGWQISNRAEATGASKRAGFWNPFRDPLPPLGPAEFVGPPRPPSPMPEEDLAPAQTKLLEQVRKQTPKLG